MNNQAPLFYILIRHYKSLKYFDKCIESVFEQKYLKYKILFVDDASGYNAVQKKYIKTKLKKHLVVFNKTRKYSLYNAFYVLHKYATDLKAIVFNLDGDDWLVNPNTLGYIADIYKKTDCLITYGECVLWDGKKYSKPSRFLENNTNIPYSKEIIEKASYRKSPFLPLHPLTWKLWLFKKIKKTSFIKSDGSFIRFAQDQAIFYPMLEMAHGKFKTIKQPFYAYNIETTNSDIKKNLKDLLKDELIIRKTPIYEQILP